MPLRAPHIEESFVYTLILNEITEIDQVRWVFTAKKGNLRSYSFKAMHKDGYLLLFWSIVHFQAHFGVS